jgi:O-antigen ligase
MSYDSPNRPDDRSATQSGDPSAHAMRYDRSTAGSVGGVIALAVAIGAFSGLLTETNMLVLVIVAAAILSLVLAREALAPAGDPEEPDDSDRSSEDGFQAARIFFYLGAATIGFLTVRPAFALTASDGFFLASLGFACLVLLTTRLRHDYLVPRPVTIGILLFGFGGLISSFDAVAPTQSVAVVLRLLYLTLIWFWLATAVLRTRQHVENAVLAWVCSAALSSGGAIAQFFYGDVISGGTIAFGRMTGFTTHFNSLGGLAATAFVPALMIAIDSRRSTTKLVGIACVGLIACGLLLSGSVGGLLAALIGVALWLAVRGVTIRTALTLGAIAGAGFVLLSAVGWTDVESPLERVERVTAPELAASGRGGTVFTRIDGYREAWLQIQANPVIGVGLDEGSSQRVLGPKTVHNFLINPWFSAGIFGLLGILAIIAGAFAAGSKAVRLSPPSGRPLAAALLASLVVFVVFAMGEPIIFVRYGWFAAALLITLHTHQRRAAAAAPAASAYTDSAAAPSRFGAVGHG